MLEQMRNVSSVFSKTLLGLIALSFILFYGYGSISRRSGQGHALIAKVNDEGISVLKFNAKVRNQNALLEQFGQNKVTPEMQQMVENQVLQRMISNVLLSQAAYRLGLRVPDAELADEIRKNPNFQKNGVFDEDFYLNKWIPYYQHESGGDFEYDLKQDLLVDKLHKVLDSAAVVSQGEVDAQLALENTSLKLNRLQIPLQGTGGAEGMAIEDAKKVAQEWISDKKAKKSVDSLLKAHGLKEESLDSQTLLQLEGAFGREDSLAILNCLLTLKPQEVCDSPFQVGPSLIAIQLVERKTHPLDDAKAQAMSKQLAMGQQGQLLTGILDLLTKQATIHTYMANKNQ